MSSQTKQVAQLKSNSPLAVMADRLAVDQNELQDILLQTIMPGGGKNVSQAQFIAFMAVANNYNLDPLKKEIYAFPANGGAIQPIVSIDGWLRIIQSHAQFDGMVLDENMDAHNNVVSVTCTIYRKDRTHPTIITEYLSECRRATDPWKTKPIRMLRHKAVIQCGRYAFGLGGIMEQDEYEAMMEREVNPAAPSQPIQPAASRTEALKGRLRAEEPVEAEVVAENSNDFEADEQALRDLEEQESPTLTFADIAEQLNTAGTPAELQLAVKTLADFCATGDNDKFKDELGQLYRARLQQLKAIADETKQ